MSQVTNNIMSQADKVVAINWQITQGFNALGLKPGQEDSRLAVEIADLIEVKDIGKITVKLVNGEVSIVFSVANPTALEGHLAEFIGAMKRCGYVMAGRELQNPLSDELTLSIQRTHDTSNLEPLNMNTNVISHPTAVAAALADAGLVKNTDGSIGADPLVARRDNLTSAEQHLDQARADLLAAGASVPSGESRPYRSIGGGQAKPFVAAQPAVTPVYPEGQDRATGFQAETMVKPVEDATRVPPATAARVDAEAQAIAAQLGKNASSRKSPEGERVDAKMSKGAKIALAIGGVALLSVGIFYGGRKLGYFASKVAAGEATPEAGTVVDAVVAAFSK